MNGLRDPNPEELNKLAEFKETEKPKKMPDLDINALKTAKGVPEFWLKAMQNDADLKMHITEADVPVLKHLTNIRDELMENNVILASDKD